MMYKCIFILNGLSLNHKIENVILIFKNESRAMNVLQDAGIMLAFFTGKKSIKRDNNPLSIQRNGISKGNLGFIFIKLLTDNRWDYLKRIIKVLQGDDCRRGFANISSANSQ
jgi:hypothetical protein